MTGGAGTGGGTAGARRPAPAPARPWRFPAFQRRSVGAGTVLAAHLPQRPLATLLLAVDAGASAEPTGQEGVALLTARLLGEGAGGRDAYGFALAAERLGAAWDADAGWDALRVGVDVPAANLPAAAALLADAVRRPALDAEAFARLRADRIDELKVERSQPGPRAAQAFAAALYDPADRYARPDGGDPETVAALTRDHVAAFHAARFRAGAASLLLAGDLDGVDVAGLAATVFDGWDGATPPRARSVPAARPSRRVVVVDRPGSVQSMLVQGHDGPARTTPDYVPLTSMAFALGGLFTSRLNTLLREELGYTYGAFAGFELRRDGGVFAVRAAVHTEVTAAAAAAAAGEVERMRSGGLTDAELAAVVSYRTGVFPLAFSSPHGVAAALGDLVVHGLPDDYHDRVREQIAGVRRDEVDAAARARLRPESLLTVVVGDAGRVVDDLRGAGLGEVEVRSD